MEEKTAFEIIEVTEWNWVRSRVIGAANKPEKDTPKAMKVKCNECGAKFAVMESASGEPGTFLPTLGGQQITCMKCGASGEA